MWLINRTPNNQIHNLLFSISQVAHTWYISRKVRPTALSEQNCMSRPRSTWFVFGYFAVRRGAGCSLRGAGVGHGLRGAGYEMLS